MDPQQREQIEQFLYGLHFWEKRSQREVFLSGLLRGHPIWLDIKYDSQREAAESLLRLCDENATKLLHGQRPICALLRAIRSEYDGQPAPQAEIDHLAAELCGTDSERARQKWKGKPYRGLSYFDRRHWPIFFGREAELQGLIDALTRAQGQRFLIVVGASGSGKSSLARAGLWARLARGAEPTFPGSEDWLIAAMTPTDMPSPMAALHAATASAIREQDGLEDLLDFDWDQGLADIAAGRGSLGRLAEGLLAGRSNSRWLLILDQMEELFTSVDETLREGFIEQLIDATKPAGPGQPPRLRVVGTLRADFFHYCVTHPSLRLVVDRGGQFLLGPPDRPSLEHMVSGPLTDVELLEKDPHGNWVPARWGLDPGLAAEIAADAAGREGGLALMAFALRELCEVCERNGHRHLDLATYRGKDFGGLGGAIARRADATLRALGEGFGEVLGKVFAHLVRVGDDELPTRRRARLETWQAGSRERRLLDRFIQARLLVARGRSGEPPTVEVAHEALLREWPLLTEWIRDAREALRLRDRLREETRVWVAQERPSVRLWKHELLDPARRLLAETNLLEELEKDRDTADFLTPEADWLLAELLCNRTGHTRREAIGMRLSEIGDPRPGVGVIDGVPDILWCPVPQGEVEIEGHGRFEVRPFHIAAYPVTYGQYRTFLDAEDGYRSGRWWDGLRKEAEPGRQLRRYASYPADSVSCWEAMGFCRWLSDRLGIEVRLPDEWEWQWAAQSARDDYAYPWGPDWLEDVTNTGEAEIGRTTAVGMYPEGRSAQGVYDLAGNLWEWCRNPYGNPKNTEPLDDDYRVARGGSWYDSQDFARAAYRYGAHPDSRYTSFGFRVLLSSPIR